MNIYQSFALLMEHSVLQEYSSAIALARNEPTLPGLLAAARVDFSIPHDLEWQQMKPSQALPKPRIGQSDTRLLVLIIGADGTAIVDASQRTKTLYSFKGFIADDSGRINVIAGDNFFRQILNSIRDAIGLRHIYYALIPKQSERRLADRRQTRYDRNYRNLDITGIPVNLIFKKIRPLLVKIITKSEADIKGFINTMISSGNYEEARNRLMYLEKIIKAREDIENNEMNNASSFIGYCIRNAILLSIKYLYPEEADDDYALNYGSYFGDYHRDSLGDLIQRLIKNVEQGDMKTLSIILAFFKRTILFRA